MNLLPLIVICAMLGGWALRAQAPGPSSIRSWGAIVGYDTEGRVGFLTKLRASGLSTAVLRSDGRAFVNGAGRFAWDVPLPPAGTHYVDVDIYSLTGIGLLSDGTIAMWGHATGSPPWPWAVPALPAGVTYTSVRNGSGFFMALRSEWPCRRLGAGECLPVHNPCAATWAGLHTHRSGVAALHGSAF